MTRDDTHRTLLEQATQGEESALHELLSRHLPRVRAFIRLRMDAGLRAREQSLDLVQSVCADLLRTQDGFQYRSEAQFRSWLFTAAMHKIAEKQRFHGRQRRDPFREEHVDPAVSGDDVLAEFCRTVRTPSQSAMAREQAERLEAAFDALPEHYREVISLARIAELPHAEIASKMGKNVGAVRQMLGRAMVKLHQLMGES